MSNSASPKLSLAKPDWIVKTTITDEDWRLFWSWENARTKGRPLYRDERFDNPYHRYLDTRHWKRFRASVMILAEHRCGDCNGQATDIHHLSYANLGRETHFDVIPLCADCHMKRHGGPLGAEIEKIRRLLVRLDVG